VGLRQAGLIFRAEGVGSLVVSPRSGEALRVRRIFSATQSGATVFATIINDTARVGFFRLTGIGGNHMDPPRRRGAAVTPNGCNFLDYMIYRYGFLGYPVVQGESLTVQLDTGTADLFAVADSYDVSDIKSSDLNGSRSSDMLFLNYGTNSAAITTATYTKIDASRNPAEMMRFPFGAAGAGLVPAGKRVTMHLLGGQAVGRFVSGGNTMNTQYIRPRVGSAPAQTILDRNDVGLPFIGTVPGGGVDYTSARQVLSTAVRDDTTEDGVVPELTFGPNDELALQVSTQIAGTGQLNAADIDVWALLRVGNV